VAMADVTVAETCNLMEMLLTSQIMTALQHIVLFLEASRIAVKLLQIAEYVSSKESELKTMVLHITCIMTSPSSQTIIV
jgi:hypothetical protein